MAISKGYKDDFYRDILMEALLKRSREINVPHFKFEGERMKFVLDKTQLHFDSNNLGIIQQREVKELFTTLLQLF